MWKCIWKGNEINTSLGYNVITQALSPEYNMWKQTCKHTIHLLLSHAILRSIYAIVKPRSHCPSFQSRRRYGVDTGANRDHIVATPASPALSRDTLRWTGVHREVAPVVSMFLKQPELSRTGLRNNAGLFRVITVALPAWTVSPPYDHRAKP